MKSLTTIVLLLLLGTAHIAWNTKPDTITGTQSNISDDIITKMDRLIQEYTELGYEGGIYVSSYGKGRTLFSEDYFSANDAIDERTIFGVASVNKTITATAIFRLIEQGRLDIQTRLGAIFENVPLDKKDITIQQLLTHTSGIADNFIMEGEVHTKKARALLFEEPLLFRPSEGMQYSSDAFNLLAMVIEKVSGTTYEKYVRSSVLEPLGMKDTFFWEEVVGEATGGFQVASFENPIPDTWKKRNWGFIGSGGMFLTLSDLSKVADIYRSESNILSQESINEMVTPIMDFNSRSMGNIGIAKGCFRGYNPEGLLEYIASGTEDNGHNAIVLYFPEKNLRIAVLANSLKTKDGGTVTKEIAKDIYSLFQEEGKWLKK